MNRSRDPEWQRRPSPAAITIMAAGTSLVIGLVDTALGQARFKSFTFEPPFLTATTLTVFAGYIAVWWTVCAPLIRFLRLNWPALSLAVALGFVGLELGIAALRPAGPTTLAAVGSSLIPGVVCTGLGYVSLRRRLVAPAGAGQVLLAVVSIGAVCAFLLLLSTQRLAQPTSRPLAVGLAAVVVFAIAAAVGGRRRPRLAAALLALLWIAAVTVPAAAAFQHRRTGPHPLPTAEARPIGKVLLIVADTLRGDVLSFRSPEAPPTPNLDALAEQSLVFTQARAPSPWTLPSMCSLLTGEPPIVHRATRAHSVLPDAIPTLAEQLAEAGYRTAAFGDNHLLSPRSNLDRGFHEYHFFPKRVPKPPLGQLLMQLVAPYSVLGSLSAKRLNELAIPWLEAHAGDDFFVWLHYYDVHLPYAPPPAFLRGLDPPDGMDMRWRELGAIRAGHYAPDQVEREWIEQLYRAEVRYFDAQLGKLIEKLRELGIYDETLIVFTSDHGEEFWEHGGFEHGHTVYDELLSVPLLLKLPGQSDSVRIDRPVSIEAVSPTILRACGLPFGEPWPSATPLLGPENTLDEGHEDRTLFACGNAYYEGRIALTFAGTKYIRFDGGREELYDLDADPGETRSLVDSSPELLAQMRRRHEVIESAAELRRQILGVEGGQSVEIDEELAEQLRVLGYVK